jgi:ATP-dependent DNA helicase RecG
MKTTREEIESWKTISTEHERLEFKAASNKFSFDNMLEYCVALANEGGGKLVLGITNTPPRDVIGSQAFDNPQKVAGQIFQQLHFRVDVEEVDYDGKRLVVFHAPPRPKGFPYAVNGRYLMRVGESLVAMTGDRLRAIFDEGKPEWPLLVARSGCSAEEVVELLDAPSYFSLLNESYPSTRTMVVDRLAEAHLVHRDRHDWEITNLGALLFAKRLQAFGDLARKAPRVVRYEGRNKVRTLFDQEGVKGYAAGFSGLMGYLGQQLPSREEIGPALRANQEAYPKLALRELAANALVHQDLQYPGQVMIEIYDDRVEFSNPGEPITPVDRFINLFLSRNERMANVMRRLRICEEKGSGIDKVIDVIERQGLPPPEFRSDSQRTHATLFVPRSFDDMDAKERVRAAYQHCCLLHVSNNKMTNATLRKRFGLSDDKSDASSRIIAHAVDEKLIKLDDPETKSRKHRRYVPFWA